MKYGVFSIILFFVCLNVSVAFLNETQLLGDFDQPPYETMGDIENIFVTTNISGTQIVIGGVAFSMSLLIGYLSGNFVFGGTLAVILFAISLFMPVVTWVLFGFPIFLEQIGCPAILSSTLQVLMSVIYFWFIIGFLGQRTLEGY